MKAVVLSVLVAASVAAENEEIIFDQENFHISFGGVKSFFQRDGPAIIKGVQIGSQVAGAIASASSFYQEGENIESTVDQDEEAKIRINFGKIKNFFQKNGPKIIEGVEDGAKIYNAVSSADNSDAQFFAGEEEDLFYAGEEEDLFYAGEEEDLKNEDAKFSFGKIKNFFQKNGPKIIKGVEDGAQIYNAVTSADNSDSQFFAGEEEDIRNENAKFNFGSVKNFINNDGPTIVQGVEDGAKIAKAISSVAASSDEFVVQQQIFVPKEETGFLSF